MQLLSSQLSSSNHVPANCLQQGVPSAMTYLENTLSISAEVQTRTGGAVSHIWIVYNVLYITYCSFKTKDVICLSIPCQSSQSYETEMSKCHQRAAENMVEGAVKNGGIYIKLGQGLCSFNHLLPPEYVRTLQVLEDKALNRRYKEVRPARIRN